MAPNLEGRPARCGGDRPRPGGFRETGAFTGGFVPSVLAAATATRALPNPDDIVPAQFVAVLGADSRLTSLDNSLARK